MDELISVFVQESREQLAAMEAGLLQLESSPTDGELINSIFRSAHTIKGGAGVIECDFIVAFTHIVENALDRLRNGEITVSGDLVALLLACKDHMESLVSVLEAGGSTPNAELQADGDGLLKRLKNQYLGTGPGNAKAGSPAELSHDVEVSGGGRVETDSWYISLRFGPNVLRNGMDPLSFLRYLGTLGKILKIETIPDGIPAAEEMDPESCYLGFEINFQSSADKAAIERVFDFVRDECDLHILPPHSKLDDYIKLIQELPEDTMRLGEILVHIGALTPKELNEGLVHQSNTGVATDEWEAEAPPTPQLGQILVDKKSVQPELVEAAVVKQKQVSDKKAQEAKLIRVQADKLDHLIDLVGELVIAGASSNLAATRSGQADLIEATSILSRLVENIRDSALRLRMVQIGETFSRFNRVVRDVSKELSKEIELVISGGETELDKSMVEKISDPLMHLVRNAMDHGIEPTEVRRSRGKDPRGRVELNAYHDSGSIVIEVIDNGGGINRERVLQKARERGLIDPNASLGDAEIFKLLFEAGFSTAEKVTDISGRGVGMDVVRRNIEALRGTIEVESREGAGSTFRLRLPLTLAIIDGFLMQVGDNCFVVPLDAVVECLELSDQVSESHEKCGYVNLRGEVLPLLRLKEMFDADVKTGRRENIVVVRFGGQKVGLVVDDLLGEFQTVIKPLGRIFQHLQGISGSTILGSGEVALILDVQALIERAVSAVQGQVTTLLVSEK